MSGDPNPSIFRVNSAADLDALIGIHVTHEPPEVFWADSNGVFQFMTESEAREAASDPYYQQFLPDVDWTQTEIRKVSVYRPCCSDTAMLWHVIEKASEQYGPLSVAKKQGRWWAGFASGKKMDARTPVVAVCLAALDASGIKVQVDHDRVDAELNRKLATEEKTNAPDSAGFN